MIKGFYVSPFLFLNYSWPYDFRNSYANDLRTAMQPSFAPVTEYNMVLPINGNVYLMRISLCKASGITNNSFAERRFNY